MREVLTLLVKTCELKELIQEFHIRIGIVKIQGQDYILLHVEYGYEVVGLEYKANILASVSGKPLVIEIRYLLAAGSDLAACGGVE